MNIHESAEDYLEAILRLKELYRAQEILEQTGCLEGQIHRFLLAARKA